MIERLLLDRGRVLHLIKLIIVIATVIDAGTANLVVLGCF